MLSADHPLLTTDERDKAIEDVASSVGVKAERGRKFAELTSLRVGGSIDWVITPRSEEEAARVAHDLDESGIVWRVLGAGSNVLAVDGEHHYVVMNMREVKGAAEFDGERVKVSAGFSLPRLCIEAARRGLAGIEGLGGIPGTIGGALWMNAGAFGHEIGTVVESVRVARGGRVVEIAGSEVEWNYRQTSFRPGELLLGATLHLRPDDREAIEARMNDAKQKRLSTQPHGARSAGCFFKNPPNTNLSTGRMIDELGMKGARRGGAIVSPVHANFIVTEGAAATATDTLALAEEIRERIRRERGIELEYEVELWKGGVRARSEPHEASGERLDQTSGDTASVEIPRAEFDNANRETSGETKEREN